MAESLAEPVRLARSLGVHVTRLRIKSLHPIPALLEAVAEQDPGILVFGPDRRRMMRLRYWRSSPPIRFRSTPSVLVGGCIGRLNLFHAECCPGSLSFCSTARQWSASS